MSKAIQLSDEQYQTFERAAETRGQTPAGLLAQLIEELRDRDRDPRYYETDDWLRHLGMSDETIRKIDADIRSEAETGADTPRTAGQTLWSRGSQSGWTEPAKWRGAWSNCDDPNAIDIGSNLGTRSEN